MERDIDKKLIERQAKDILEKFAKALEKVEKENLSDSFVDRESFEREEGKGEQYPKEFKKKMLDNSPKHDSDFIIAEKGGWK